jgi:hypothetical protein
MSRTRAAIEFLVSCLIAGAMYVAMVVMGDPQQS